MQECVIIDSTKGYAADRKPMKADAILMHRSKNIIAVRAQQGENTVVQVRIYQKFFEWEKHLNFQYLAALSESSFSF